MLTVANDVFMRVYIYLCVCIYLPRFIAYRVAKTHRMPYLYEIFSAKEPSKQWLFFENRMPHLHDNFCKEKESERF